MRQASLKHRSSNPQAGKESKVKERKRDDIPKTKFLDFVYLTQKEGEALAQILGTEKTNEYIKRLNDYIGSKGKKYKSHYFTIRNWAGKDGLI